MSNLTVWPPSSVIPTQFPVLQQFEKRYAVIQSKTECVRSIPQISIALARMVLGTSSEWCSAVSVSHVIKSVSTLLFRLFRGCDCPDIKLSMGKSRHEKFCSNCDSTHLPRKQHKGLLEFRNRMLPICWRPRYSPQLSRKGGFFCSAVVRLLTRRVSCLCLANTSSTYTPAYLHLPELFVLCMMVMGWSLSALVLSCCYPHVAPTQAICLPHDGCAGFTEPRVLPSRVCSCDL